MQPTTIQSSFKKKLQENAFYKFTSRKKNHKGQNSAASPGSSFQLLNEPLLMSKNVNSAATFLSGQNNTDTENLPSRRKQTKIRSIKFEPINQSSPTLVHSCLEWRQPLNRMFRTTWFTFKGHKWPNGA
jgi:hypothetical protein